MDNFTRQLLLDKLPGIAGQVAKLLRATCPCVPPVIVISTNDSTLCEGSSIYITTPANTCVTYQWQENIADVWTDIPGETTNVLTVDTPTVGVHTYRLVGSNTRCEGTSNEIEVEVVENTVLAFDIADDNEFCAGGFTTLYSEIQNCGGEITYQWQSAIEEISIDPNLIAWIDIPGATSDTYVTPVLSILPESTLAYFYRVKATCDNGCIAYSDNEPITILADAEVFVVAEDNVFCDGGFTFLHAEVIGGAGSNNYQWQEFIDGEWIDIVDAVGADYLTPELAAGTYQYRLMVTQDAGCLSFSESLTLTVVPDPVITIEADDETISAGGSFTLTSEVTGGNGANTYQWQWLDGVTWTDIFGANSDTFTNVGSGLPNGDPIIAGTYTLRAVVIQDSGCESFSNEIIITVT